MRRARERSTEREQRRAWRPNRATKASLITGAALAGTAVFAAGAQAGDNGNYAVNTLADHAPDGCEPYVAGDSDCTLREAVIYENQYVGDDTVIFESDLSGAIHINYYEQGQIEIYYESLTIDGPGEPGNEVITVNGDFDSRIFKIAGFLAPGGEVTIDGLTLRHGAVNGSGGAIVNTPDETLRGGGPELYAGSLTITDSVLTDNVAFYESPNGTDPEFPPGIGGAVADFNLDGLPLTVTDSVITDNIADGGYADSLSGLRGFGGGIGVLAAGLDIDGSRINDNTTLNGPGGGIAAAVNNGAEITDSTINRNSAGLVSNEFTNPVYEDVFGGGGVWAVASVAPWTIQQTTVADNESILTGGDPSFYEPAPGGGIHFEPFTQEDQVERGEKYSPLTIVESTLSGNQAGERGGGLMVGAPQGPVLVENSTFSNNAALYQGGGIFFYNRFDVPAAVHNSTITDNEVTAVESTGGGIFRASYDYEPPPPEPRGNGLPPDSVELVSTIVAENYAAYDGGADLDDFGGPGAFYLDFSLVRYAEDAELYVGTGNLIGAEYDPQLLPLGDNGGPTETHLPGTTSPVLDQGTDNLLTNDQRLLDRIFDDPAIANADDGTDIGAVEIQGEEPPPEEPPVTPPGGGVGGDVFEQCLGDTARLTAGTPGNDDLTGTFGDDVIRAFAGDDRLRAIEGRDCLFGDDGNDLAKGGGAVDLVEGGAGDDRLKGQGGADTLDGGLDSDNVNGDDGKDRITGDDGNDKLGGNQGNDRINAGSGNDRVRLGVGKDKVRAGSGNDRVGAVDALKDKINCGGGDDRAVVDPIDRVSSSCEEVVVVQADE